MYYCNQQCLDCDKRFVYFDFFKKNYSCDLDGQSKGFGFITFEKLEDAQKAIQTMNGQKVLGKEIEFE